MRKYAIIVAGGKGSRFGSNIPKQFLPLKGKPVLMHTIEQFYKSNAEIIVALPENQIQDWNQLCIEHKFTIPHKIVTGGSTRFHSVKNAIDCITPVKEDLIAVHDGVRPLVSTKLIEDTYSIASKENAVVPAIEVTDTIRQLSHDGNTSSSLLRSSLRAVQTPQTFNAVLLKKAYSMPFSEKFTDDASVVEAAGHCITLTQGSPKNIKITHAIDLIIAEEILQNE